MFATKKYVDDSVATVAVSTLEAIDMWSDDVIELGNWSHEATDHINAISLSINSLQRDIDEAAQSARLLTTVEHSILGVLTDFNERLLTLEVRRATAAAVKPAPEQRPVKAPVAARKANPSRTTAKA